MSTAVAYGRGVYGAGLFSHERLSIASITLDGVAVPLDGVVADVTIRHGRAGFFDSASPSTAQVSLLGVARSLTRSLRLGAVLAIVASDGVTVAPRFTGRLTDGELLGSELTLIGVGRLRTLSGYTVGAIAYPEELWSARVARAFTEAGLGAQLLVAVGSLDPLLLARPIEPVSLSQYLDDLAAMVEAAVADLPDGRILVQALGSRTNASLVTLDPDEVAYAPGWEMRLPTANVVTVRYGSPEASVTVRDDASVDLYGPLELELATEVKTTPDATAIANGRLARNAYSHWSIPAASLLYGHRLALGAPAGLSSLPAAAPYGVWAPILEGWTDRIVSDGEELVWTMELALSDPLRSGLSSLTWQTVPATAGFHWNTIDQAVAWRDALSLTDLVP